MKKINVGFTDRTALAIISLTALAAICPAQYSLEVLRKDGFNFVEPRAGTSGYVVGVGRRSSEPNNYHALLWQGQATAPIDLTSPAYTRTMAFAAYGNSQVGRGDPVAGGQVRALLWHGTAESVVDLTPEGSLAGIANAVSATTQGGASGRQGDWHATLWRGTAASAVLLDGGAFEDSRVQGVSEEAQVGWARRSNSNNHATLWRGTWMSSVDLHPESYLYSYAYGVSGAAQVGYASNAVGTPSGHAFMWTGTRESAIDLNPTGFDFSSAQAISGNTQVGKGRPVGLSGAYSHALAWNGSAASVIDLHPAGYITSTAEGIAENGDIFGYGTNAQFQNVGLVWHPVPEPGTLGFVGIAFLGVLRRRRS
ncbi:MAG: PEP-CTERM sorting domain-containing protein [Armatimonadetes bacterium]|nr:PEP-CTERM sorting domain-containing protein [Armatimonadota bacterium]